MLHTNKVETFYFTTDKGDGKCLIIFWFVGIEKFLDFAPFLSQFARTN